MPAYNCRKALLNIVDNTIEVAIGIDEIKKFGTRHPDLDDALLAMTTELFSWGLEDERTFERALVYVPQLCREILSDLYGEQAWGLRPGMTTNHVYQAFYPEFENLRKVLLREEDVDLERARKFSLSLNRVGLAQSSPIRHCIA